ncbi:MAG: S8 family serine peptidase [Armatimonadetes bacterium]|nr:S8 family serine peptidase [Armatimonadota bacterium]
MASFTRGDVSIPNPVSEAPAPHETIELTHENVALPPHVEGEALLRLSDTVSEKTLLEYQKKYRFQVLEEIAAPAAIKTSFPGKLLHVRFDSGRTGESTLTGLSQEEGVQYAEPNLIFQLDDPSLPFALTASPIESVPSRAHIPNDLDSRLWGMHNTGQTGGAPGVDINAPEAWSVETGNPNGPILAVIDTGIDYTHPDLAANIWTNPGEIPGNGIDDDGNGFVDDVHGYDFANNDGDPMDDNKHGTHCAGTIAGEGNNGQGVVGVSWRGKIMPIKFLTGGGSGSLADAVKAIFYATQMGARITSNSWGGGGFNQSLRDALAASPALNIFAAGNSGQNSDVTPGYPAAYDLPNIVSVAAVGPNGELAGFSNYGARSVDLGAPGVDIYSTVPGAGFASLRGTSMACPHVSGAAYLTVSRYPNATNDQIKGRLLGGAAPLPSLQGKVLTGGMLNVSNALENDVVPPSAPGDFKVDSAGAGFLTLTWKAPGDDADFGSALRYELRMADHPIAEGTAGEGEVSWQQATPVSAPIPESPGSQQTTRVLVEPGPSGKTYHFALRALDNVGNSSPLASASGTTLPGKIVFQDDGEGETVQWTLQEPWGRQEVPGHGKVWTDSPKGNYPSKADISMTSVPIGLSGIQDPMLSFYDSYVIGLPGPFGFKDSDVGKLEVSGDGGSTWNGLETVSGKADWQQHSFDLKEYEGKTIQVRYRLTSDQSLTYDGWKIDNILVAGTPTSD